MKTDNDTARDQAVAQYESIVNMLAAVSCDYDRLEELRDLKNTLRYVAGWNMPGYMPDSEPAEFDDCDDAREYIASELESMIDADDAENVTVDKLIFESHITDLRNFKGEFGRTIGKYHYFVTQDGNMLPADDVDEFNELETAAGDCENEDDARERIQEDPLEIQVRSDWTNPGEELTASEFMILLCTGGPTVRIMGELDEHKQPSRAWLEYQDWGTRWTEYGPANSGTLCEYASNFFFGE